MWKFLNQEVTLGTLLILYFCYVFVDFLIQIIKHTYKEKNNTKKRNNGSK